jgi:hypothetical protein
MSNIKKAIGENTPENMGEGCGCAAMILAAGVSVFLVLAAFQLAEIVKYLTAK